MGKSTSKETDNGKELVINNFTGSLINYNTRSLSHFTSKEAVVAERFRRTHVDLCEKPVFEKLEQTGMTKYLP